MHFQDILLVSCFFIGYLLHTSFGAASTTVTCTEPGKLMQTHDIDCAISGTIASGITWINEKGLNVAGCSTANLCFPNAGYTVPVATPTSNTLRITNLQVKDVGSWQCRDGAAGIVTRNCNLTVLSSGNCNISVSGSTLEVDLQQYFCSASTSFQVENDQGTSCDLSLDNNTVSAEVRDNSGTCEITQDLRGTVVHPVLICGSFRENISCSIEINSTPGVLCDCLPCLIIAAILAALVIILIILLLCIGNGNSTPDRGSSDGKDSGKCFKCGKDNHGAKTCEAPNKGKSRKWETTVSGLDDKTIEKNLKKHLETMKIQHSQIDMNLGTITVDQEEKAQFNIAKEESQVEIYLYWKNGKETHHLIFQKNYQWRLALFIVCIILIIASLVCLIYPLAGCSPLEGLCVGSVVVSGLGILLGIVGLLLCFCWKIAGCSWLCSCCNRGNKNSDFEMTGQSTPFPPRQPGTTPRLLPQPAGPSATAPGSGNAVNPSPRQLPPLSPSARGPPPQPSNVTVGDPANSQSSDITSASNVKPEVNIDMDHNSATGTPKKKKKKKKKKVLSSGAGIGSTVETLPEVDSDGDGHIGK